MTDLLVFNQWKSTGGCSTEGALVLLPRAEAIAVLGVNILAPLSHTPLDNPITLMVNGLAFSNVGTSPDFSVSGNTITWLSSTYSVSSEDHVVALYYYMGLAGDSPLAPIAAISTADEGGRILTADESGAITTAGGG